MHHWWRRWRVEQDHILWSIATCRYERPWSRGTDCMEGMVCKSKVNNVCACNLLCRPEYAFGIVIWARHTLERERVCMHIDTSIFMNVCSRGSKVGYSVYTYTAHNKQEMIMAPHHVNMIPHSPSLTPRGITGPIPKMCWYRSFTCRIVH